jgi:hypothetical protein
MRSGILILFALCIFEIDAHFYCLKRTNETDEKCDPQSADKSYSAELARNLPQQKMILNLRPILSLEGVCFDLCNECYGQGQSDNETDFLGGLLGGTGNAESKGVLGDVLDMLKPIKDQGLELTGKQACMIPCIAKLNVLKACDVQAIVAKLVGVCPNLQSKAICVSACLCCGENKDPLDICVNVCLERHNGDPNNAKFPIIGETPVGNVLPQDGLGGLLPGVGLGINSKDKNEGSPNGVNNGGSSSGKGSGSAPGGAGGSDGYPSGSGSSGSSSGSSGSSGSSTGKSGGSSKGDGKDGKSDGKGGKSNGGSNNYKTTTRAPAGNYEPTKATTKAGNYEPTKATTKAGNYEPTKATTTTAAYVGASA